MRVAFSAALLIQNAGLLLLTHAFEKLDAIAVELRTHWHNHASRTAISRLGTKQNGVLRNHHKVANGVYRELLCFQS